MRRYFRPGLLIQAIEELINGRITPPSRVQDKVVQSALQTALFIYIIFDVMSSSLLLQQLVFFDAPCARNEKSKKTHISQPQRFADTQ